MQDEQDTMAYKESTTSFFEDGASRNSSHLQDSEFTADSTSENFDQGGGGWFSGIGSDFRNIAHCLTDNVPPVVTGVANLVHRTAVAVANEIAQLERDGELEAADRLRNQSEENLGSLEAIPYTCSQEEEDDDDDEKESLVLPWEIRRETPGGNTKGKDSDSIPVYFTDNELMEDILALSRQESTFMEPFKDDAEFFPVDNKKDTRRSVNEASLASFSSKFVMDESRIQMIRRLMDIDQNLSSVHSRFSGKSKVKEELFWKNYFFHCENIRSKRLQRSHFTQHYASNTKDEANASPSSPKPADVVETIAESAEMTRKLDRVVSSIVASDNVSVDDDEESLVPAESLSVQEDDSSYVIPSAPNSVNTFATTRSIGDDVVLVNATHDTLGKY